MEIAPGAVILRNFVASRDLEIGYALSRIGEISPFRKMFIYGGKQMSVAMTNAGTVGWIAEPSGYRYDSLDPLTGKHWPPMGSTLWDLAVEAAAAAGYSDFDSDCCLINKYEPGSKLSLHQDKDEHAFDKPIVSVSLGLAATFQFGGIKRSDPIRGYKLEHGDVVVFGGASRLCYHGVLPLRAGTHALTGPFRFNLTFRQVY